MFYFHSPDYLDRRAFLKKINSRENKAIIPLHSSVQCEFILQPYFSHIESLHFSQCTSHFEVETELCIFYLSSLLPWSIHLRAKLQLKPPLLTIRNLTTVSLPGTREWARQPVLIQSEATPEFALTLKFSVRNFLQVVL